MSSWILNIVGVIFIGVILDVILPDGKTNSFIKHIFSIFLLFVIISPVNTLLNKNFKLNLDKNVVNENFVYSTNIKKVEALEKDITKKLEDKGFNNVFVLINANVFDVNLTINSVYVDTTQMQNKGKIKPENIYSEIENTVLEILSVSKEEIVIYGK